MYTARQGLQSIKPKPVKKEDELDIFSTPDKPNGKVNNICYAIVDLTEAIAEYIDLTEHFLKRFLRGNQYLMVGYHYNTNYMQELPIKNRTGQTITEAWEELYNTFAKVEAALQTYVPNNKKSRDNQQL